MLTQRCFKILHRLPRNASGRMIDQANRQPEFHSFNLAQLHSWQRRRGNKCWNNRDTQTLLHRTFDHLHAADFNPRVQVCALLKQRLFNDAAIGAFRLREQQTLVLCWLLSSSVRKKGR